jgi:hypothetical protein
MQVEEERRGACREASERGFGKCVKGVAWGRADVQQKGDLVRRRVLAALNVTADILRSREGAGEENPGKERVTVVRKADEKKKE